MNWMLCLQKNMEKVEDGDHWYHVFLHVGLVHQSVAGRRKGSILDIRWPVMTKEKVMDVQDFCAANVALLCRTLPTLMAIPVTAVKKAVKLVPAVYITVTKLFTIPTLMIATLMMAILMTAVTAVEKAVKLVPAVLITVKKLFTIPTLMIVPTLCQNLHITALEN